MTAEEIGELPVEIVFTGPRYMILYKVLLDPKVKKCSGGGGFWNLKICLTFICWGLKRLIRA